ncbi:L,D-transpeptidase [Mangrovicoccus algicola]|uniref:L,D-transpeptidase n=1 Tax=Mangrovicoccus algicola TaxID=2771008 RepID=A0A8J6Z784_9RHOB|nr:L,D-transpeptidase [Mangrovicoccus algicola]MBE3637760.1 L,D-transpeptidase [Mangrovicoccus algicola]
MLTRRTFLATGAAATLAACAQPEQFQPVAQSPNFREATPKLPDFYGPVDDKFPIPAVPEGVVPQRLWRQVVANPFPEYEKGTLVVDPDAGYLHLIQDDGNALRYGAGTGAAGREWDGGAVVQFTRSWPRWNPPDELIARNPKWAPYSIANGGMDGGPGNPLGARALYLFQNGVDTLYRIHGGCEPEYLGKAVSSGCIRLLDQDAIDLEKRVTSKARVVVLPSYKTGIDVPVY